MNRIGFMTQLAALLQDVPVEERREAMQYYNDYFDDAGAENEQQVIEELESPKKVAENIQADLKGTSSDNGGFTENGYTDARFDDRKMPEKRYEYQGQPEQKEPPRTSNAMKIILMIAIVLVGGPVLIPLALGLVALVAGCLIALVAVFASVVVMAVSAVIAGVVLVVNGIILLIPDFAVGIGLLGFGLILTALGVVGTVAGVRLCVIVLPAIFRAIVSICRKPFHRKEEVGV